MSQTSYKKIIIGLVVLCLVGVCACMYLRTPIIAAAQGETDTSATSTVNQNIVDLLLSFQNVSINSSLFSSPLFQSLKDFNTVVPTPVPGRPDPFAPIGNDTGVVTPVTPAKTTTTTTSSAKTTKQISSF